VSRRARNAVVAVALLTLSLPLVAALAIVIVANTEAGTRWAIERVGVAAPGTLETAGLQGTLWRGVRFTELSYQDQARRVTVTDPAVEFELLSLLARRVTVTRLRAESVEYVAVNRGSEPRDGLDVQTRPLPFDILVEEALVQQFTAAGNENNAIRDLVIDGAWSDGHRIRIDAVALTIRDIAVTVGNASLLLENAVPLSGTVRWRWLGNPWSGWGSLEGTLADIEFDQSVEGPFAANVSGTLSPFLADGPQLDAVVNWTQWVFGTVRADGGEAHIQGWINAYQLDYTTTLGLPGQAPFAVVGNANGSTSGIGQFAATLENTVARLEAAGAVSWSPAVTVDADVHILDADAQVLLSAIHGRLTGDVRLGLDAARLLSFDGQVRIGANELRANGTLSGNQLAATGEFDFAGLGELMDGLSGSLGGAGRLSGTLDSPLLELDIRGQDLRMAATGPELDINASGMLRRLESGFEAAVESASVMEQSTGRWTLQRRAELQFGAGSLAVSPHQWNSPIGVLRVDRLEFAGDASAFAARMDGLPLSLTDAWMPPNSRLLGTANVTADLARVGGEWSGSASWLQTDVVLRVTKQDGQLTDIVFPRASANARLDAGRLTANAEISVEPGVTGTLELELAELAPDTDMTARLKVQAEQLAVADSWMPLNSRILGTANLTTDLTRVGGEWSGSASWLQTDTVLRVTNPDGEVTDIVIPRASARATLDAGRLTANAGISVEPGVTGTLDLELAQLAPDAAVTARLRLQGDQWEWITALVPQVDRFEGSIGASIDAAGALSAPELSGTLEWHNGHLLVPALNVPLNDVEVVITGGARGTARLEGSVRAGDGSLALGGQFSELMSQSRSLELHVQGKSAEVINWPEYHVWASPDLILIADAEGWRVGGNVTLPRADIAVRELPAEAVSVSPDVIVIGEEEQPATAARLNGNARLVLGDRVRISAFGLDSLLRGELVLRQRENRPLTAEGRISLVEGVFEAYGQKLTIERGELTFTGPLDDPIVDVRAIRQIDTVDSKVTAGLYLTGRAQNLTATVFSEPAMAEADALSYLVVGRPLNQATEAESGDLTGAAVALGIKQASRLVDQIGQSVGLDQLSLTGDGGESTALVAGKQVNRRLYARYAYGVFSRLGMLLLRYRMSERITLEASAGETQAIDVLYSVETD